MPCPEADKFRIVAEITARLKARTPALEVLDIDGARYRIPGGWGLIRASNTGPILVLRFEAEDRERLEQAEGILREELATYGLGF